MSNPTSLSDIKKDQLPSAIDARLQVYRGLEADLSTFVFRSGEAGATLDTKRLLLGDGVTPGGHPQRTLNTYGEMAGKHTIEATYVSGNTTNCDIFCITSNGQFGVQWWDGTVTLHNSSTTASKANGTPTCLTRKIIIFPVRSQPSDELTTANALVKVFMSTVNAISVKVGLCPKLTELDLGNGGSAENDTSMRGLVGIDLRGAVALTTLLISGAFEYLEFLPPTLVRLEVYSSKLKYIDCRGLTSGTGDPAITLFKVSGFSNDGVYPTLMKLPLNSLASVHDTLGINLLYCGAQALNLGDVPNLYSLEAGYAEVPDYQAMLATITGLKFFKWHINTSNPVTTFNPVHANLISMSFWQDMNSVVNCDMSGCPNLQQMYYVDRCAFWENATLCNYFFNHLPIRPLGDPGHIIYGAGTPGDTSLATARGWSLDMDV